MAAKNVQPRSKARTKRRLDFFHVQDLPHAHAIRAVLAVNGTVLAVPAAALNEQHAAAVEASSCISSYQQLLHSCIKLSRKRVVNGWSRGYEGDADAVPHVRLPHNHFAAQPQQLQRLCRPRVPVPRINHNTAILVTFHPRQRQLEPR